MKKILVSGNFNIIHPGHVRLLRFAKSCGDYLIVAVQSDQNAGKNSYIREDLRLDGVMSNGLIDEAFIFKGSILDVIEEHKPDIVVKGKEHESLFNIELEGLSKYGGKLVFSSGETLFSSLDLIRNEYLTTASEAIGLPEQYISRHELSKVILREMVKSFEGLRVCIVGDLIVDEYIACQTLGLSQEDPAIVVTPIDSEKFIGGAGIVAAHAASLKSSVSFISVIGDDEIGKFSIEKLKEYRVESKLIVDFGRPTTLKQRFRSSGKSLLKVSYLHQEDISIELQDQIYSSIESIVKKLDILIFSDFNYGCLPIALVKKIIKLAKKHKLKIVADSQSSSQIGDITKYRDVELITPTEREARIGMKIQGGSLIVLADTLMESLNANNVILKMGGEGFIIQSRGEKMNKNSSAITDRIEALNIAPKDVAGAGDSLLVGASLVLAAGGDIWTASLLGAIMAGLQVSKVGNIPISVNDILNKIELIRQ